MYLANIFTSNWKWQEPFVIDETNAIIAVTSRLTFWLKMNKIIQMYHSALDIQVFHEGMVMYNLWYNDIQMSTDT